MDALREGIKGVGRVFKLYSWKTALLSLIYGAQPVGDCVFIPAVLNVSEWAASPSTCSFCRRSQERFPTRWWSQWLQASAQLLRGWLENRELIQHGVNGLVFERCDVAALTTSLLTVVDDAKLGEQLSRRAATRSGIVLIAWVGLADGGNLHRVSGRNWENSVNRGRAKLRRNVNSPMTSYREQPVGAATVQPHRWSRP
jgi:hypothetical protein